MLFFPHHEWHWYATFVWEKKKRKTTLTQPDSTHCAVNACSDVLVIFVFGINCDTPGVITKENGDK